MYSHFKVSLLVLLSYQATSAEENETSTSLNTDSYNKQRRKGLAIFKSLWHDTSHPRAPERLEGRSRDLSFVQKEKKTPTSFHSGTEPKLI